jgi:hypothetical protein
MFQPLRLAAFILGLPLVACSSAARAPSGHAAADSLGDGDDAGASQGDDGDDGAPPTPSMGDVDAPGAIAELQQQLQTPPLAPYYQDTTRIEGCWANPAGNALTDIQKAFYCSMPLEFRLCNSVVLIQSQDTDVATRWQGFVQCEQTVDAIAGGTGAFVYDAKISATYYWLFLDKNSGLSSADEASLVAANQPASSGRSFPELLQAIVSTLATEAGDAAFNGLQGLIDQANAAASAAGVSIE